MRRARTFWTSFSKATLDWIYPPQCALCTLVGAPAVCEACASDMRPLESLSSPPDDVLSFRLSAFEYGGRAAQAVRRLKYSRATALSSFMSSAVHSVACETDMLAGRVVLPVPIHWRRRCARGFNQAERLCESFPADVVLKNVLIRSRATPSQAGLNADQRRRNLEGAFRVNGRLDGKRVLLVDDVLTTGNTGRECAKVLMAAGAVDVGLITFAAEL